MGARLLAVVAPGLLVQPVCTMKYTYSTSLLAFAFFLTLEVSIAQNYLYGDPIAACWATTTDGTSKLLKSCPGDTTIKIINSVLPEGVLDSTADYHVKYRVVVDECAMGIPDVKTTKTGAFEVPHANLHSCRRHVGACTPFVANTPGLATHSPSAVGNLTKMARRSNCKYAAEFVSILHLEPAQYTVLLHGRVFVNGVKYDICYGMPREAKKPEKKLPLNTGQLIAIALAFVASWSILTGPTVYILQTHMMDNPLAVELKYKVLLSSFCDALDVGASVLMFAKFHFEGEFLGILRLVSVSTLVVTIITTDSWVRQRLYFKFVVDQDFVHTRGLVQTYTAGLVLVVAACEIIVFLEKPSTTDLIACLALCIDIGVRIAEFALLRLLKFYKDSWNKKDAIENDDVADIADIDVVTNAPSASPEVATTTDKGYKVATTTDEGFNNFNCCMDVSPAARGGQGI